MLSKQEYIRRHKKQQIMVENDYYYYWKNSLTNDSHGKWYSTICFEQNGK